MGKPTSESVLNALRNVMDPDLNRDLVSLNMVRDLHVSDDGVVQLRVVLTTPACPLKEKIKNDVQEAVLKVQGVTQVVIKMDAEVKKSATPAAGAIEGVGHIIAVSSGKGGVGKSTVAVNLAVSLAQQGAKVGLLDADIYGPNIPTMMGVIDQPSIQNHPTKGEIFIPPLAHGVKVMSMAFLIDKDQPVVWRGPMLHNVLSQFFHKVDWGQLDYLIVDMPPGTGDVQLSLSQLVPVSGSVLVTTPQEVSLQDVRKAFHMFEKVRIPIFGIVENMSYFEVGGERHYLFGKDGGVLLCKKFNVELLGQVPIVQSVREGGDAGTPISVKQPDAVPSQAFKTIAQKVAQRASIVANQGAHPAQMVKIGTFN